MVVASERPVIQTVFNPLGLCKKWARKCLIIKKKWYDFYERNFASTVKKKACSFERIYIFQEVAMPKFTRKKKLWELILPAVLNL
jgi:amidophosphoribosyltransferase